MLKAIIVDDIKEFREGIHSFINQNNYNIEVVAHASSVNDAAIAIKTYHPDIVFLDVEMPDGTGFDLLQKISSISFKVIFITAYQEFSIKAFKYSAIDYILKPIDEDALHNAIIRAKEVLDKDAITAKLTALFNNINPHKLSQKLVLKTAERIFVIDINDIIRCESYKGYSQFFLIDNRKILVSKTLKEYGELLPQPQFFRAHHSHIINMNFFNFFDKKDADTIIMKDQSKVPVSSRKKEDLFKLLSKI